MMSCCDSSSQGLRHMLRAFCSAYGAQHPNAFELGVASGEAPSAWRLSLDPAKNDAAYLLSWSMMILSADQHNPKVLVKQSVETFLNANKGHGLMSQQSMVALYQSIKCCPILWRVPTKNKAGMCCPRATRTFIYLFFHNYFNDMITNRLGIP
jgi:hypothetical protein